MACTTRKPRKKKAKIIAIDDAVCSLKDIRIWLEQRGDTIYVMVCTEHGLANPVQFGTHGTDTKLYTYARISDFENYNNHWIAQKYDINEPIPSFALPSPEEK